MVDCVVDISSAGILLFVMMLKTKLITDVEIVAIIVALKNHRGRRSGIIIHSGSK